MFFAHKAPVQNYVYYFFVHQKKYLIDHAALRNSIPLDFFC